MPTVAEHKWYLAALAGMEELDVPWVLVVGSLPGSTTIMVRTPTGLSWAALCNTRTEPSNEIDTALDQMMWNMARSVPEWGA